METQASTNHILKPENKVQAGIDTPIEMAESLPAIEYDPASCTARFLKAATLGIFIDSVILCLYGMAVLLGYWPGTMGLIYTLLEIPVICGILGIFFFNEMLDLAREIGRKIFLFLS